MSLDKAIKHGKEKRKEYRGSKRFDRTCRNHGRCSYCENNRRHSDIKNARSIDEQFDEFFYEPNDEQDYLIE